MIFTAAFTVDMVLSFFVKQHETNFDLDEINIKITSLKNTAWAYFSGRFVFDLITLIPFA